MQTLLVIGGGFAGLWAALTARYEILAGSANIRVTLVSPDGYLTLRPRLYERNPETLRTPLAPVLRPVGVQLVLGRATTIDTDRRQVAVAANDGTTRALSYDRLVLATGSEVNVPPVPGLREHGWNVDTFEAALAFDRHLNDVLAQGEPGFDTAVIVGAGFTGVELATEMRDRIAAHSDPSMADKARIVLIDRADVVAPDLGVNPRPIIEAALREARVDLRLGTTVESVTEDAAILAGSERIATRTVVAATGLRASRLAEALPVARDVLGRVPTEPTLRVVGLPSVYATGDVARAQVDDDNTALMSCQHSMTMGKYAGYNAARDLMGLATRPYRQPVYVTCLDLGRSGAVFTKGWERNVATVGAEAKQLKRSINTERIYPPRGSRADILAAAHIDVKPGDRRRAPAPAAIGTADSA